MHLHRQLGLNPFLNKAASASTSLPPSIPMRNTARGNHYAHVRVDTQDCNKTLKISILQKQQGQQHPSNPGAVTAREGDEDRKRETWFTNNENNNDINLQKEDSKITMNRFCDAMFSAMNEVGRYLRLQIAQSSFAAFTNAAYLSPYCFYCYARRFTFTSEVIFLNRRSSK